MGVEEQGTRHAAYREPVLRLRAVDLWGPTLTLCVHSVIKSLIQRQVECGISMLDSLYTSLWGRMVSKAELKSMKSSLV